MSQGDVARMFGERFAKQLSAVNPGRWQGPIRSSFGTHFILVDQRAKGSLPPLDAVREAVQREWLNARRIEAAGETLSHAAGPLPDRGGDPAEGRGIRNRAMRRLAILLAVLGALLGYSAQSDEIRPGYLELRQTASDTYSLLFKIPARGDDFRLAIYVNLPEGTND